MSKSKSKKLIDNFIEFDQSKLETTNTVTIRLYRPTKDLVDFYLLFSCRFCERA